LFRGKRGKSVASNSVVSQNSEHGNYLLLKIHGKLIRGLIDTDSGMTLIRRNVARKMNVSMWPVQKGQLLCLFAVKGLKLIVDGVANVTFNISELSIDHTVYVVENIAELLILGSDFSWDNQVIIDY
jgi:hypothetical protein